ncbi:hypothetical protein [Photorhabdus heterorhabditis]|uniref:hypothetical protein n=1 Tax=Photorhabdus heterorhabditis TaxID=880156 RepID=UPI00165EC16A|nr:hypothetical protein [Photorhabdus heterorhabditis]
MFHNTTALVTRPITATKARNTCRWCTRSDRRVLERLGCIPTVEAEKAYYASIGNWALVA